MKIKTTVYLRENENWPKEVMHPEEVYDNYGDSVSWIVDKVFPRLSGANRDILTDLMWTFKQEVTYITGPSDASFNKRTELAYRKLCECLGYRFEE